MQTVTGEKIDIPAEWLALGARLGDLVNIIADRDDLISRVFPGNSSPGAQQAAAWFVPSIARVNVDADKVLPGVHPDDVDLYTPQGQATHIALMGALVHECAHAAHTVLKFTKKHEREHTKWGILLEETRIEKKALARRPQDRPFLAACATELVFGGNLTMARKDGKHTPSSLAHSAILLLGRADAGVFDADMLTDVQTYFETEFGQDEANKLREIWLKAQDLEDGDLDGLVACGKEVYDLLNEHPDTENEPQQQGDGADNDGESGDSGEPGGAGGAGGGGSSDDSTDAADDAGNGSSGSSGGSKSKSGSKGGSGDAKGVQGDSDDTGDESGDKTPGSGASNDDDSDADKGQGGKGSSDEADPDDDDESTPGGTGDGEGDEDGEAFQMPCGSWTEGNLDDSRTDDSGDDSAGDNDGEGNTDSDGKSDDALNKAIQAAMKKISVDAKRDVTLTIPVRRNLQKQREAAKREKREFIRNKNTAEKVFRTPQSGAPGLFGGRREILVSNQSPTAEDKRNANMLTKELRKAQHRDIHRTKVASMTPPGRMLINEAARRDAQRSRGEEITATPWRQTRRRMVQSPPLLVGLSVDVSGSMDAWQHPVAAFGWALANAVRTLEGKIASVAWNGGTKPVMFPGRIYKDIQVAQCSGVSTGLATSLDALDGEVDLARSEGVRVQVILTDGQIDESGIQERIDRLVRAGVLVIWVETPTQSWGWGGSKSTGFGGYVPKGVKHLPLKDPNVFGQTVGKFIANALSQHQPFD